MQMNDITLISVDDHICEPPTLFDNHLSGEALAKAPKFLMDQSGKNYWNHHGVRKPSAGLDPTVGPPFEEYGMESLARLGTN